VASPFAGPPHPARPIKTRNRRQTGIAPDNVGQKGALTIGYDCRQDSVNRLVKFNRVLIIGLNLILDALEILLDSLTRDRLKASGIN